MNLSLIFTAFTVPIIVAFEQAGQGWIGVSQDVLNFIFYIDLFANFIIAFENEDKNVEFRIKKIALNYIKSWFFIDLLACIPINFIIKMTNPFGDGNNSD
jgi:hypothetical protein